MKKFFICLLSILLIVSNFVDVSAYSEDEFVPKNNSAFAVFKGLSRERTANQVVMNNLYYEIKENSALLIEPEATKNIDNFRDILLIANGESIKSLILEDKNEVANAIIMNDIQTNTKLYYEWQNDTSDVLLIIKNQKYLLKKNYSDIELVSESGDRLVISKTYYEEDFLESDMLIKSRASNYRDYPFSLGNDSSYSKDVGPLKATNKDIFKVFDAISVATGGYSLSGYHPILGTVSFICGAISYVGNNWNGTFYIRYWRAYQLNTIGGLTRNKERWFSESSCENKYFVENYTSYFNATRPGY